MADAKTAVLEWLGEVQGTGPDPALEAPLAAAARLAGVVGGAAAGLPFGAEPPDFLRLLEELAPKEAGR
jgi:hypothetical protein